MIFIFLLSLILVGVFVNLGALSVWVHVLSVALKFALVMIIGFVLVLFTLAWKTKRNQIDRHG